MCVWGDFLLKKLSFGFIFSICSHVVHVSGAAAFTIFVLFVRPAFFQRSQLRCYYVSILWVSKTNNKCNKHFIRKTIQQWYSLGRMWCKRKHWNTLRPFCWFLSGQNFYDFKVFLNVIIIGSVDCRQLQQKAPPSSSACALGLLVALPRSATCALHWG